MLAIDENASTPRDYVYYHSEDGQGDHGGALIWLYLRIVKAIFVDICGFVAGWVVGVFVASVRGIRSQKVESKDPARGYYLRRASTGPASLPRFGICTQEESRLTRLSRFSIDSRPDGLFRWRVVAIVEKGHEFNVDVDHLRGQSVVV